MATNLYIVTETRTCIIAAPTPEAAERIFPKCADDASRTITVKKAYRKSLQDPTIPVFNHRGRVMPPGHKGKR